MVRIFNDNGLISIAQDNWYILYFNGKAFFAKLGHQQYAVIGEPEFGSMISNELLSEIPMNLDDTARQEFIAEHVTYMTSSQMNHLLKASLSK